jgi:diphthamide synthase (EF-2-diphthine--ammonia ligase)
MRELIGRAKGEGVARFAFGDLFLEDVRAYRVKQLAGSGIEPIFPLWGGPADTPRLAREMIAAGLQAFLTCVDPKQLDGSFVGRPFDADLLAALPSQADPCGERGEFHTFCCAGPMFSRSVPCVVGERIERDGFHFADVLFTGPR